jgi:hypothetical protein
MKLAGETKEINTLFQSQTLKETANLEDQSLDGKAQDDL